MWHVDAPNYPEIRGIRYKRFDTRAQQWDAETLLVSIPEPYYLKYPAVAVQPNSGGIHIVYYGNQDRGGFPKVFHKEYQPETGWLPSEQLTPCPYDHRDATVAVDTNGDLCVVWIGQDLGSSTDQVLCRRRVAGIWQEIEQVSELPGNLTQYSLVVTAGTDGNWHIMWHGQHLNH